MDLKWTDVGVADWPAPPHVRAFTTLRRGGVSLPPFGVWQPATPLAGGLNLGAHVGDDPSHVAENRRRLQTMLPSAPHWLAQQHGIAVWHIGVGGVRDGLPQADASIATHADTVCVVLTADCLPVLLCDALGRGVAAVHAGWRGLCAGVVERSVRHLRAALGDEDGEILAWLGPAIGTTKFVVGVDVRAAFVNHALADERADLRRYFIPMLVAAGSPPRFLADLYGLARQRLARVGVRSVWGGMDCTVSEPERFYSYRRDGQTGRMASLIWFGSEDVGARGAMATKSLR